MYVVDNEAKYFNGRGSKALNEALRTNARVFNNYLLSLEGVAFDPLGVKIACREIAIGCFTSLEKVDELVEKCIMGGHTMDDFERVFFQYVPPKIITDFVKIVQNYKGCPLHLTEEIYRCIHDNKGNNISHFHIDLQRSMINV